MFFTLHECTQNSLYGGSAEWAAIGHVRHSFRTVCAEARMPTGNKSHSCAWCHQTDVAHVWSSCCSRCNSAAVTVAVAADDGVEGSASSSSSTSEANWNASSLSTSLLLTVDVLKRAVSSLWLCEVRHFPGPAFSSPCDLVLHFPGLANSRAAIWSIIFQGLQFPVIVFFVVRHFQIQRPQQ